MADPEDRGTGNDPKWVWDDHTGGNDSGTADVEPGSLDEKHGVTRTSRVLRDTPAHEGENVPDPTMQPPAGSGGEIDVSRPVAENSDTVTDESGKIAAADVPGVDDGSARDPHVTGRAAA